MNNLTLDYYNKNAGLVNRTFKIPLIKGKKEVLTKPKIVLDSEIRREMGKNKYFKLCNEGLLKLMNDNGTIRTSGGPEYKLYLWHRDAQYTALQFLYEKSYAFNNQGFKIIKGVDLFTRIQHVLLNRFIIEEPRIDNFIKNKGLVPEWERIHPKFLTSNLQDAVSGPGAWGYIQNDAIGLTLHNIANGIKSGRQNIVRNKKDLEIIEKLTHYCSLTYYKDWDSGIWENQPKLNASSVTACLAGLLSIKEMAPKLNKIAKKVNLGRDFELPDKLDENINNGKETLLKIFTDQDPNSLNPKESPDFGIPEIHRTHDLTLLSLIYPYGIADIDFAVKIVKGVEENLARERGVIRFPKDPYYNSGEKGDINDFDIYPEDANTDMEYHDKYKTGYTPENRKLGNEAEWDMGFAWLAIDCKIISEEYLKLAKVEIDKEKSKEYEEKVKEYEEKAISYLKKCEENMTENGMAELHFSGSKMVNVNDPLAWAMSMYKTAYQYVHGKIPEKQKVILLPNLKMFLKKEALIKQSLNTLEAIA